jgi:predicted nucleic acid-binding protein
VSVVDASVVIDLLLGAPRSEAAAALASAIEERAPLAAPDLLDVEAAQVLRRFVLRGVLTAEQAEGMVGDLPALPIDRYPAGPLVARAFDWHANVTVYDGVNLALAEALDRPLLTGDGRLAGVPGCDAAVTVLRTEP